MTVQSLPNTIPDVSSLTEELSRRAQEMEEARRLPADLAKKMAAAGVFRMVTPKVYGGYELPPADIVRTVESISEANAAAGWCAMIAATTAMNAAYMAPEFAAEIYADPSVITGGVFAPMGRAEIDGDDYIVSGRWQWGSGSANCTWLCGGCMEFENGEMVRSPSGAPVQRMMVFPASEAELIDTWQVMGLKGTGSGDIEVKNIRVPKGRTVSFVTDTPIEGALYAFPPFGLLSLGVASVALGNARGALNAFKALALAKKSQGSKKTLAQRQSMQGAFARCEAAWRAARAYLFDEIEKTWEVAQSDGEISVERRGALRMACTHMTRTGADICREMYDLGGGAALFEVSDLQRRFRDAHAITQHIVTAPSSWELTGRLLLDQPTNASMV